MVSLAFGTSCKTVQKSEGGTTFISLNTQIHIRPEVSCKFTAYAIRNAVYICQCCPLIRASCLRNESELSLRTNIPAVTGRDIAAEVQHQSGN